MKALRQIALGALLTGVCAGSVHAQAAERCVAPDARIGLDHVPIAVDDLDALAERLTAGFGFLTKPGRPHDNGLENVHIKFEDGSGLELMTVGRPGDALAERYASLIADGGGGAYLALSGVSADEVQQRLKDVIGNDDIEFEVIDAERYVYLLSFRFQLHGLGEWEEFVHFGGCTLDYLTAAIP